MKKKRIKISDNPDLLIISTVAAEIIGALFLIVFSNKTGAMARGYFNTAYYLFKPVYAIAIVALSETVSRIVSKNIAVNRFRDVKTVFRASLSLAFIFGIILTVVLFVLAFPYAHFSSNAKNTSSVCLIVISTFFCFASSIYNGYYEGTGNLLLPSYSKMIFAVLKFVFGLCGAEIFQSIGMSQFNSGMAASGKKTAVVFGSNVSNLGGANAAIAPMMAVGAALGVALACVLSALFVFLFHRFKGDGITRRMLAESPSSRNASFYFRKIPQLSSSFIVMALSLNITEFIDSLIVQPRLNSVIKSEEGFNYIVDKFSSSFTSAVSDGMLNLSHKSEVVKYIWGSYGIASDFKNLIPLISVFTVIGALKLFNEFKHESNLTLAKTVSESIIRVVTAVSLPFGICLGVLSKSILSVLYSSGSAKNCISLISPVLTVFGFSAVIVSLTVPVLCMLYSLGRSGDAAKSFIFALAVKLICNILFTGILKINIYGAVIGTVCFYIIFNVLNLYYLFAVTGSNFEWFSFLFKPLICSAFCAFSAFAANELLYIVLPAGNSEKFFNGHLLSTVIAAIFAVVIYIISIVFVNGIKAEDLYIFKNGEKIAKTLEKYGLLS